MQMSNKSFQSLHQHTDVDALIVDTRKVNIREQTIPGASLAITRSFSSTEIQIVPIIEAKCTTLTQQHTYSAMHRSLIAIKELAESEGIVHPCVLCARYGVGAGDTQVGGTGKCCAKDGKIESRMVGASEEIAEELRLRVSPQNLSSMAEHFDKKSKKFTEVFAARVTACAPIPNFDPLHYGSKTRRGCDVSEQRIGFLPWGSLSECLDVLVAQELSTSDERVDGIDGVSVVSIHTAIQMVHRALTQAREAFAAAKAARPAPPPPPPPPPSVTIRARVKFWKRVEGGESFGYAVPVDSANAGVEVRLTAERVQEAGIEGLRSGDVLELTITQHATAPRVVRGGLRRVGS
jgi:hypothetical protein